MRRLPAGLALIVTVAFLFTAASGDDAAALGMELIAQDEVGGHPYSQIIYAPTIQGLVTWGTRNHSAKIRAHETQHYLVAEGKWIDAWPTGEDGKPVAWAGKFKSWGDWNICDPTGSFYDREGVKMPRPNSSFYQCCWDDHNKRVLFYVGSMTFSYDPAKRQWTLIHDAEVKEQPPALLLWGSLCYDPVNKQVILFGGGGVDAPDGRPHTWALDVTTDKWKKLQLETEPPARCNSRMVYDSKNKLIVLFGGDGQDRGLADTWVFDVTKQQWQQRQPKVSPPPRHGHAMAYLAKSGVVLMVGGHAVSPDYRRVRPLSQQAWVYDAAKDTWKPLAIQVPAFDWASMEAIPGTDQAILATATTVANHSRKTYRVTYDPSAAPGQHEGVPPGTFAYKTSRTKAWQSDVPPPDLEAYAKFLASLPVNQWVEVKPPKSTVGRTWGTAIFDVDRGVAMKWGGGHSGYQGTDMAFYNVAANRFAIDMTPAFTPDPFKSWARRPGGRTFFNTPWARHQRHTCAYDAVRKVGVFCDAGGSDWLDRKLGKSIKWTWIYDPAGRKWYDRLVPQPFPGGGSVSPIAVPTPKGVVVYQHASGRQWEDSGQLFRFVGEAGKPESWAWEEIKIEGPERPYQREHMTIVYDSKRDRLIFLSGNSKSREPEMWFFNFSDRKWVKNPEQPAGGVTTREAVYVPEADAVLAYGPGKANDDVWTRVYLCGENRWAPLPIKTPQYLVHEVALEYDPIHKLALLLWPPSFEQDIRPHLFRLDVSKLGKGE